MWAPETSFSNTHVFSEGLDIVCFTVPIAASVLLTPFLLHYVPHDELPLGWYIALVVLSDVAHVWSTLFRTHFDSCENSRRKLLYNGSPFGLFALQFAVHYFWGEEAFWTIVGYVAIYHFLKQQYGLMMLAKVREKDFRNFDSDRRWLYAGCFFPVAVWHCDGSRGFDWFNRTDPLPFQMMPALASVQLVEIAGVGALNVGSLLLLSYVLAAAHLLFARTKRDVLDGVAPLKGLIILYAWISWAVGVLMNHKVVALLFLNFFHAAPAFVIVFCVARNRWRMSAPKSWIDRFAKWMTAHHKRLGLYLGFLMLLACVEEFLWESLVWQDYTADSWEWDPQRDFGPAARSAITAFLILPQTTHYFLDAFIWKLGKETHVDARGQKELSDVNPGLRLWLAIGPV